MLIATWNLNNRVGKTTFQPDAANAAISLGADVLVFTEYYPQEHHVVFAKTLRDAGWSHQHISKNAGTKPANLVFIASRLSLQPLDVRLPDFDQQFPSNVLCVRVPSVAISIVGIRIPWYENGEMPLVIRAWDWLQSAAADLKNQPAIILGDLNVQLKSPRSRGGEHFRNLLASGWQRAIPKDGSSFVGDSGTPSEIDHILGTSACGFSNARYATEHAGYRFSGGEGAISDHAALLAEVRVAATPPERSGGP